MQKDNPGKKKKGEAPAQADQPQTAPVEVEMTPEVEAVVKKIGEQGDKVRQLKSSGADKVEICFCSV